MPTSGSEDRRALGRVVRAVLPPVVFCTLLVTALWEPIRWWLHGEEIYDQEAIREWIREARVYTTLPELVEQYLDLARRRQRLTAELQDTQGEVDRLREAGNANDLDRARQERRRVRDELRALEPRESFKREEIEEHLKALGNPPTKIYTGQLPLFPIIYRITVDFDDVWRLPDIVWDSEIPRHRSQFRELPRQPIAEGTHVEVEYRLHAYLQRQFKERQETTRRLWLSGLGIFFALLALLWIFLGQRRERERRQLRLSAERQVGDAERLRLEEELRRQEAERKQQNAERQNLELKSQLFANIGIMAGSYAHNIKNLLVRPNDLLRRCLEESVDSTEQSHMLHEVKQTLGTVTERLQQILQTVRRDPSKAKKVRIDLNAMARDMQATWALLAREKWKLHLEVQAYQVEGSPAPLWIEGDMSHLQQALENLLFNARDATFEMRNHLRDQARHSALGGDRQGELSAGNNLASDSQRRQAMIAAAGWKGRVILRTRLEGSEAILEVEDNGIGMTDEVLRRCTETHFSTKRDNALFAGLSAGMGLGLSFVSVILDHHHAKMQAESVPLKGTTFRVHFPVAGV